jgi:hypothetical protein
MMEAARTSETSVMFYQTNGATTQKTTIIALMMEAASTSETSVNLYQTTWRNNPEDNHHHPDDGGSKEL